MSIELTKLKDNIKMDHPRKIDDCTVNDNILRTSSNIKGRQYKNILTKPACLPTKLLRYGKCGGEGMSGKESDRNSDLSPRRRVGRFKRLPLPVVFKNQ